MHIIDAKRRLDHLVEKYPGASDPDERSRIKEQIRHYRKEIEVREIEIAELKAEIAGLDFEIRYETDPVERDHIGRALDSAKQKLSDIADKDG